MRLIKLMSTKVRRRVYFAHDFQYIINKPYILVGVNIQTKVFGLFWKNYVSYAFNIKSGAAVKLREVCCISKSHDKMKSEHQKYCHECGEKL